MDDLDLDTLWGLLHDNAAIAGDPSWQADFQAIALAVKGNMGPLTASAMLPPPPRKRPRLTTGELQVATLLTPAPSASTAAHRLLVRTGLADHYHEVRRLQRLSGWILARDATGLESGPTPAERETLSQAPPRWRAEANARVNTYYAETAAAALRAYRLLVREYDLEWEQQLSRLVSKARQPNGVPYRRTLREYSQHDPGTAWARKPRSGAEGWLREALGYTAREGPPPSPRLQLLQEQCRYWASRALD